MNCKSIILSLLIFNSLYADKIHAQVADSILHNLTKKLSEYTSKIPREEIFIHSDREEYISGEDFWFNVYLFDRKELKLSGESKIVYVEILNALNKPVVQRRILIKEGTGPGHFILPDTLSTGYYTLRAYTGWMKNFMPVNCFMKEITVFNTLKNDQPESKSHPHSLPILKIRKNAETFKLFLNQMSDSIGIIFEPGKDFHNGDKNIFYLIVQTRGNLNYACTLTESGSEFHGYVPVKNLMPGINQITVFDYSGKPLTERLVFTPGVKSPEYSLQVGNSYKTRESINPRIIPENIQRGSKFSISATYITKDTAIPDIEDYLIFGSEFNTAEGTASWQSLKGRSRAETDSILSGLSSNWIRWKDIISSNIPPIRYPVEKEYHFLNGKIEDGNLDTVILCFPGKLPWFQYTIADDTGNFSFNLHIDEEAHDLVLMTTGKNGKKVLAETSFQDSYIKAEDGFMMTDEIDPVRFSKMGVNFQVGKIFRTFMPGASHAPLYNALKPVSFYGLPHYEIRLSDFVELPDMSEIFLELIPDVSLRQRKTGYEILISDRINDEPFFLKPQLMIDGVVVRDASLIAGISPELVEKIDVVKRKYLVGSYLFNGLVNVITKAADFSCISLPDYMTRTNYQVAEPVPVFIPTRYQGTDAKNSRIPDYRNTLYWNPLYKIDDAIQFMSSDNRMKCLINIQGVTDEGRPFSIHRIITIE